MTLSSRYSNGLFLADLAGLKDSSRNGGEDTVQAYYGWRDARASASAKGLGASAASLLAAWLIPFLKNEYAHTPLWLIVGLPVLLIIAMGAASLFIIIRMNQIHRSFISAIIWLRIL